jgi:hypothetical protein
LSRDLQRIFERVLLFVTPFTLAALYVMVMFALITPDVFAPILAAMFVYLLSPLGVEIVIPSTYVLVGGGAAILAVIVLSIVMVDVFTAVFMFWNFDLAERIPGLGGFIRRTEAVCSRKIEEKKWGEGVTMLALAAYVALPFQMSGGVVGSIFGRVLGIDRRKVLLAVSAGSAAGGVPVGVAAFLVGEPLVRFLQSGWLQFIGSIVGILIVVGFILGVSYVYWKTYKRNVDGD